MAVFLKRNDIGDVIDFTCENEDGTAVNLQGATVKFNMGKKNKLITSGTAEIVIAAEGKVQYQLKDSDTLHAGNFPAEFEVTFQSGKVKTFPTIGYLMVNIEANLDNDKTSLVADEIAARVSVIETFKTDINQKVVELTNQANKVNDFEARINNIVAQSGTSNTETVDARLSVTGYAHASLRAYLNSMEPVYGTTTNSGNDYTLSLPGYTKGTYGAGYVIRFKCNAASSGNTRLRINTMSFGNIMKSNGANMTTLKANVIYTVVYDSFTGNFILQGEGGSGDALPANVLAGKTFSNDNGDAVGTMTDYNNANRSGSWANATGSTTVNARPNDSGYFTPGSNIQITDVDLIPANIKKGVDIFNVVGTYGQFFPVPAMMLLNIGNPRDTTLSTALDIVVGYSKSWIALTAYNAKYIYIVDRSTMKVTKTIAANPTDAAYYMQSYKGIIVSDRYFVYPTYNGVTAKLYKYDLTLNTHTDITPASFSITVKMGWGTNDTYGYLSSAGYVHKISSTGTVSWTTPESTYGTNDGYIIGEYNNKLYLQNSSGYIKVFNATTGTYLTYVSGFPGTISSAFIVPGKIIMSQYNTGNPSNSFVRMYTLDSGYYDYPTTVGMVQMGSTPSYSASAVPYDKARTKILIGRVSGHPDAQGMMDVYDLSNNKLERSVTGYNPVNIEQISPNNEMISGQLYNAANGSSLYGIYLLMTGRDIDVF